MNYYGQPLAKKVVSILLSIRPCTGMFRFCSLILGAALLLPLDVASASDQEGLPAPESMAIPALNGSAQLPESLLEDSLVHGANTSMGPVAEQDADESIPGQVTNEDESGMTVLLDDSSGTAESKFIEYLARETKNLTSREGTGSSIKLVLLLGALSLAPAGLLMTTCYVRIIVVLSLLRQAFGAQQLPPNQVIAALSLFLTLLVMTPVWQQVKSEAIDPYSSSNQMDWEEAWQRGIVPVKNFMGHQIEIAKNGNSIGMFYKYVPQLQTSSPPSRIEDVPITVLLPAFIVSELKVAFLLGFQIFLPFLVLDFVVSTVTVSMGMLMLPPTMVSFPLKLILFVMVDGWSLVVGMLLQSFGPFS